jgi:hypothetical protein
LAIFISLRSGKKRSGPEARFRVKLRSGSERLQDISRIGYNLNLIPPPCPFPEKEAAMGYFSFRK